MCSPSRMLFAFVFLLAVSGCVESGAPDEADLLRVCADPNNMPFSNEREEGFENELAELVADALHRTVSYTWFPQRRGFIRNTLRAGACDVVIGIPSSFELAQPTEPYYRSTYVFVTRTSSGIEVRSLDDPALRTLTIGVHLIGDDYTNVPPAHALARRDIIDNVRGYSIYGDYSQPDPPAALIRAVAMDSIDLAIAWGPLAGYFAAVSDVPLTLTPVLPQIDPPFLPFVYDVSMGVRRGDDSLRRQLDSVLHARREDVDELLARYHVPVVGPGPRPFSQTSHQEGR